MSDVIAVLCSDIHLSHKPPIARSCEDDWYAAMARPLRRLGIIAKHHAAPIVCAGDIFDRWNSPPELINFALKELPRMWSIPGQHDLPNHSINDIKRSAYWTLVEAGHIQDFSFEGFLPNGGCIRLWGFPYGNMVSPLETKPITGVLEVAVIHSYCWMGQDKYTGAPKDSKVTAYNLAGYDVAHFGDNHKGFIYKNVCNTGTLMRRTIDEKSYTPFVGLLHTDGTLTKQALICDEDLFLTEQEVGETFIDMSDFFEELKNADAEAIDFRTAVNQYLEREDVSDPVRAVILEAME